MRGDDQERRTPEEYLRYVQREEKRELSGKLKIFLGMAAGVGKTYAMLEAAQILKSHGVDLVIGVVDPHGRPETARLAEGLEQIPLKTMQYHQTTFQEMDLDAILKRKPQVALVDELAHQNVPGSRHPKRWQDVIELLDQGISVYTTLNVQHIESLKDVVERIAGITIRETVPDMVIDRADSIELIDLTPDELRQRLREGKVYLGSQSTVAAENFFQEDRLTALREIVLRYSAEKVDQELRGMVSTAHWIDEWKPRERLMVAISHSPHSQKLIRITRRLAYNLDAPWIAVHIDDGTQLNPTDQDTLSKNLALARDLGAEVITTSETDIAQALKRVARQKGVTQIIIGRSPRKWYGDFLQGNALLNSLARECSEIDLHIIRQSETSTKGTNYYRWFRVREPFFSYLIASVSVLLLTAINLFMIEKIGYRIAGFSFLLAILTLSLFFRFGPILFASVLYALIWVFIFIPAGERSFGWNEDSVMLACYFFTALFTGILTSRAKKSRELVIKRERAMEALYEIVHEIANASSFQEALVSVQNRLSGVLDTESEILFKKQGQSNIYDSSTRLVLSDKERVTANWVVQNGKEAGWSTSALPFSENLYIPIKTGGSVVGLLVFHAQKDKEMDFEEKNFIYSVAQQLGIFYEKYLKAEEERLFEEHRRIEKTYASTLELIANLFEGPLLTIQDSIKELRKTEVSDWLSPVIPPLDKIQASTENLSRVLENISAMVNLKAGFAPLHLEMHDIGELILICCETLKRSLTLYKWDLVVEEDIPPVLLDYDLVELLFYNIVFHAIEFSPPESTVKISVAKDKKGVKIDVWGEGPVIPTDTLEAVFEKFYRMPGVTQSGLGLGLAIAKVIADILQGELILETLPQGGIHFALFLPYS